MPTNRTRRTRKGFDLKPWEKAFLTGDDSEITPGSRAAVRLEIMRNDPDGRLMFGDKTGNELLKEFKGYADNQEKKNKKKAVRS